MRCAHLASNGPDHLGLCVLQGAAIDTTDPMKTLLVSEDGAWLAARRARSPDPLCVFVCGVHCLGHALRIKHHSACGPGLRCGNTALLRPLLWRASSASLGAAAGTAPCCVTVVTFVPSGCSIVVLCLRPGLQSRAAPMPTSILHMFMGGLKYRQHILSTMALIIATSECHRRPDLRRGLLTKR